ncbi:hypothetical protein NQZ68_025202 [Dissostichus eleginoides]|nr:hypothetical protein NQZ68_025202 [Dissostichus eleginoides]
MDDSSVAWCQCLEDPFPSTPEAQAVWTGDLQESNCCWISWLHTKQDTAGHKYQPEGAIDQCPMASADGSSGLPYQPVGVFEVTAELPSPNTITVCRWSSQS